MTKPARPGNVPKKAKLVKDVFGEFYWEHRYSDGLYEITDMYDLNGRMFGRIEGEI